ncbi:type II secretion system protein [Geomonas sp.]|uniref:type II secretion system protein n=1 Tax=Geomonas sp. TaxID=2651584 RepID=UPI002B480A88|nr:type II secretion system protein [Geomonas sp.]HJV36869.1 type II secretion system protein [Geomonas sp.]
MRRVSLLRSSAGFTYIGALVMVVVLGIMAARAVTVWKTAAQREKETELLFRGMQYMDGLRRWYWPKGIPTQTGQTPLPGQPRTYPAALPVGVPGPKELKELLKGTGASPKPCLRKLFLDPMTLKEFEPIKGADGRILGVHSTSEEAPIKQSFKDPSSFNLDPSDFEGKSSYKDWVFICTHWPRPLGDESQTGAGQGTRTTPP